MENLGFLGKYKKAGSTLDIQLTLFKFKEEGLYFIYSPFLDITGYGKTESEAKESFNETLLEFINYTDHKNTLDKELKKLGWKVVKRRRKPDSYNPPELSELLRDNDYLIDIVNNKDFTKISTTLNIPTSF